MSVIDDYFSFKFIFLLTQRWEDTDAFKAGIVDKNGKELKKRRELKSQDEKRAYTRFHKLVYGLKRMLDKVPFAKSTVGRYATALLLIKEETGYMFDKELKELMEDDTDFLKEELEIQEFNGVGGVDMGTSSGLPLNKRNHGVDIEEDIGDDSFAGNAIFDCDSATFADCRLGKKKYLKYKTFVGEDETGERIRKYGRANPKKGVILRDSKTKAMLYLRRGDK